MNPIGAGCYRDIEPIIDQQTSAVSITNDSQLARQLQQFASVEIFFTQLKCDGTRRSSRKRRGCYRDQSAMSGRQFAVGDEINLEQRIDESS